MQPKTSHRKSRVVGFFFFAEPKKAGYSVIKSAAGAAFRGPVFTCGICNNNDDPVHGERANFTSLALGCIEAKIFK